MEVFTGRPVHPGVAIASAARLRLEYGVPTLDPQRLRRLGERLRRFGVEVPEADQIILIAESVPPGFLGMPVPGLEIAGVVVEGSGSIGSFAVPTVCDVDGDLLASVAEDDIVLVDGDRGRVYVDPDALVLARYQAPARRSRRFFLGSAHLPARTLSDNRFVSVLACVSTLEALSDAVDAGADGVVVPPDNDFIAGVDLFQTSEDQENTLRTVLQTVGGKPVLLQIPTERLALSALARASASGTIHVVLSELDLRAELGEHLRQIERSLDEQEAQYGSPRFEAGLSADEDVPLPETLDDYVGVFVTPPLGAARMEQLLVLSGLARGAQKSLTFTLSAENWRDYLPDALALNATRVVTEGTEIGDVKDAIREL